MTLLFEGAENDSFEVINYLLVLERILTLEISTIVYTRLKSWRVRVLRAGIPKLRLNLTE
jgi:hypothetical protein